MIELATRPPKRPSAKPGPKPRPCADASVPDTVSDPAMAAAARSAVRVFFIEVSSRKRSADAEREKFGIYESAAKLADLYPHQFVRILMNRVVLGRLNPHV